MLRRALPAALVALLASCAQPPPARTPPVAAAASATAAPLPADWVPLTRALLGELVGIDTSLARGSTAAAERVAAHLRHGGIPAADVAVVGPKPDRMNVVARLRAAAPAKRPLLLLAHLDVVDAHREDWTTDPFTLVEKDGFYYGRGVLDDKAMAAIFTATLLRLARERTPVDRDVIVALTADEEDGDANGVDWLVRNRRDLVDAAMGINEGGGGEIQKGRYLVNEVQASEKTYQTFFLETEDVGGHSSQPGKENAIYRLAAALGRVAALTFPARLSEVTRGYFAKMAPIVGGALGDDMRTVAATPEGAEPDPAALARLSDASPYDNAMLRTTCVATRVDGGHAENALPQRARATVNCRVLPGDAIESVEARLLAAVADPKVRLTAKARSASAPPSPLSPELMDPVVRVTSALWPSVAVVPIMSPSATDAKYLRNAGIPTYGVSGLFEDVDDSREHGKDERILVKDYDLGAEFLYRLVLALTTH